MFLGGSGLWRRGILHGQEGGDPSEGWERGDGQHIVEVRQGEDAPVGVSDHRPQGVVHPSPARAREHPEQGHAAKADGLGAEPLEPQRLVAGGAAVVDELALQHRPEGVRLVINDVVGRRCDVNLEALSDMGLVVRPRADVRDAVLLEKVLDGVFQ